MKRTILITGASSGIGQACCQLFLQKGHQVIGISRQPKSFDHPLYVPYSWDLSNLDDFKKKKNQIQKAFAPVDTLVLSAGKGLFYHLEELSLEQMQQLWELNFASIAFLVRLLLPELKKKQRADLFLIGSEAALQGKKKSTLYSATKFALRGFAQALREECATSCVKVTSIQPGMVRTPFYDPWYFEPGHKDQESIEPEDIAEVLCFLLELPLRVNCDEILLSPLKKSLHFKKPSSCKALED